MPGGNFPFFSSCFCKPGGKLSFLANPGGKLFMFFPGIYEGRGIGKKQEAAHNIVKFRFLFLCNPSVYFLCRSKDTGNASEHFIGGFGYIAVLVAEQVSFLQYREGVFGTFHKGIIAEEMTL